MKLMRWFMIAVWLVTGSALCSPGSLHAGVQPPAGAEAGGADVGDAVARDPRESLELGEQVAVLEDPSKSLTIHQVTGPEAPRFRPNGKEQLDFGVSSSAWWLRVRIRSELAEDARWLLTVSNPHINRVDLYVPKAGGGFDVHTAGNAFPFEAREILHPCAMFELPLEAGQVSTFYLRVESIRFLRFSLVLASPAAQASESSWYSLLFGAFYGLLAAIALYNLSLFIFTRDRNFLIYVIYAASILLAQLTMDGLAFQYLWPNATTWVNYDKLTMAVVSILLSLTFARSFLHTREYAPRLDRVIQAFMGIQLLSLLLLVTAPFKLATLVHLIGSLLSPLVVLTTAALIWRRGYSPARYFLVARVVVASSVIFSSLSTLVFVRMNALGFATVKMGVAAEALLLSIALADRINVMKREKERAQQEALENMKKVDRLKDEFLANTSHELRTPLNGIIGIAESMLDGAAGALTSPQSANLNLIVASGRRLASLVNDILDFARLKQHDLTLRANPVDMREIAELVCIVSSPEATRKGLTLRNEIPTDFPPVRGDENRLQQILYNLVGNAVKFTETGSITVSAAFRGDVAEITVTDTGIGIPADRFEAIFQSFEQADASISREYGGTGLGLSITRQLVELHDGTIRVASEVGRGSSFTFTLPVSAAPVDREARVGGVVDVVRQELRPLPTSAAGGEAHFPFVMPTMPLQAGMAGSLAGDEGATDDHPGAFRILVVDDDPVNLQVLLNQLSMQNYTVLQAASGKEALEVIQREGKPDLILLDVMMPRMSGLEVCRRLREIYPPTELPIIFLTARNQVSDLVEGLSIGANDYQTKPFARTELLARIRNHLQLSQINAAYGRFVPHEFLRLLNHESIVEVRLGDQVQKEMTILFADIRSFTTLSESMSPRENFNFLNSYLTRMTPAIRRNGGFIDKYIGDAIMALFPEQAEDAVQAAIEMHQALHVYNLHRANSGYAPIRVGMGIHSGSLILGTIGSEQRMEGTVISDAVNLASRLEHLTKLFGATLILSAETLSRLPDPDRFEHRSLGRVKVKGKTLSVAIFELFGADAEPDRMLKARTKGDFEQGVALFEHGERGEALALFRRIQAIHPDDLATRLYLQRLDFASKAATPPGWELAEAWDH